MNGDHFYNNRLVAILLSHVAERRGHSEIDPLKAKLSSISVNFVECVARMPIDVEAAVDTTLVEDVTVKCIAISILDKGRFSRLRSLDCRT